MILEVLLGGGVTVVIATTGYLVTKVLDHDKTIASHESSDLAIFNAIAEQLKDIKMTAVETKKDLQTGQTELSHKVDTLITHLLDHPR